MLKTPGEDPALLAREQNAAEFYSFNGDRLLTPKGILNDYKEDLQTLMQDVSTLADLRICFADFR
jgi:hypothetical protein